MQNKNPLIIVAVVVLVGIIGGVVYATMSDTKPHDHNDGTHSHSDDGMVSGNDDQTVDADDAIEADKVAISNFEYSPKVITIKAGTEVTWTNEDGVEHNAASDDGDFEGPMLAKGESWSYTFEKPGTYGYHCSPHPYMKGTVIVTE